MVFSTSDGIVNIFKALLNCLKQKKIEIKRWNISLSNMHTKTFRQNGTKGTCKPFLIFFFYHYWSLKYGAILVFKNHVSKRKTLVIVSCADPHLPPLITVQGGAKGDLQLRVHETQFILVLLFFNYHIISHTNNRKPTFAHAVHSNSWCLIN